MYFLVELKLGLTFRVLGFMLSVNFCKNVAHWMAVNFLEGLVWNHFCSSMYGHEYLFIT